MKSVCLRTARSLNRQTRTDMRKLWSRPRLGCLGTVTAVTASLFCPPSNSPDKSRQSLPFKTGRIPQAGWHGNAVASATPQVWLCLAECGYEKKKKKRLTKHTHHHNHRHSSPLMCKLEAVSHTCCVVGESLQSSFCVRQL